jgi:hypothetical protein
MGRSTRFFKVALFTLAASTAALVLYACGEKSSEPTTEVVAEDAVAQVTVETIPALFETPLTFETGVPDFEITTPVTLSFATNDTAPATPEFSIKTTTDSASGVTTFGSCIFTVSASTFPAGSRLAMGNTIVVNPCNINVQSAGLQATGVSATRSVALLLGAAASSGASINVSVNPGGQLTLNGISVGTVTLVPFTGAGS